VTPSIASSRRSTRSSSISSTSHPTPIAFPSLDDTEAFDSVSLHRLDQQYAPVSLTTLPPKRLRLHEIVRLRIRDEFILFLPPDNKNNPPEVRATREYVLDRLRKIIMANVDLDRSTTAADRDA
jgi:hypothetical protein